MEAKGLKTVVIELKEAPGDQVEIACSSPFNEMQMKALAGEKLRGAESIAFFMLTRWMEVMTPSGIQTARKPTLFMPPGTPKN